jgi:hypothetical protein
MPMQFMHINATVDFYITVNGGVGGGADKPGGGGGWDGGGGGW